ncbi:MAG: aquaporin [Acidobacteriota bacterium]
MDKYVTEGIGTFFLVLTVGLCAHLGPLAPAAVGCVLMAVIYAGGHISAAHYNPVVTVAFWRCGRCPAGDIAPYIGAQLTGAALASGAAFVLAGAPAPGAESRLGAAFLAETLFTFALVWVILNVAAAHGTAGNPFYGAAIATVVVAGAYAVGPISGAVFNPAVGLGLCLMGIVDWASLWLYLAAPLLGALVAAAVFKVFVAIR